jgi:threonine aldolase
MEYIDLRSDTVTRPTPAMRNAMAAASVGDDVYGEDPTVIALERRVAGLLGKEAALFVPSGTMGNQIALLAHTRPGDEVLVGEGSHCMWYESGAGAALAGVQFQVVGRAGLFSAEELEQNIKPRADYHPRSSLVVLENTHNRGGGRIFPADAVRKIAELARERDLRLHLDGARLWNASIASGRATSELAAPFDSVSVCFSKGLGAPVGSAFVATRETVQHARRLRKMLGGGMRQAGILAAGALYALDHHLARLADDHAAAQSFAAVLADGGFSLSFEVQTNIVLFGVDGDAGEFAQRAAQQGVLINATAPKTLRAVTHLDVTLEQACAAAERLIALRR